MTFIRYFKTSMKRSLQFVPRLLALLLIFVLISFILFDFVFSSDEEPLPIEFKVGLVGDISDKRIRAGLDTFLSIDASGDYLEIIEISDEKDAVAMLENGVISGYLFVPDNFVSSAMRGENVPAKFVTKNTAVDLAPLLICDVLNTVSNYVVESQVGVFAMEDYYIQNDLKVGKSNTEMSFYYLDFVLTRDGFANVHEIGSKITITTQGYYFSSFIIILTLVIGMFSACIAVKSDLALPRILYSRGVGCFSQTLSEFFSFLLMSALSITVVFLLLAVFGTPLLSAVPEFESVTFSEIIGMMLKVFPAVVLISSMQFFIYELCSNIVSATLLQFVASVLMAYVSGCFYPSNFLPALMQKIASYLPVDMAFNYIKSVFANRHAGIDAFITVLIMSLIFIVLSVLTNRIKIRSNIQ